MYAIAFNAISDALEELDKLNIGAAKECLKEAQFHTSPYSEKALLSTRERINPMFWAKKFAVPSAYLPK